MGQRRWLSPSEGANLTSAGQGLCQAQSCTPAQGPLPTGTFKLLKTVKQPRAEDHLTRNRLATQRECVSISLTWLYLPLLAMAELLVGQGKRSTPACLLPRHWAEIRERKGTFVLVNNGPRHRPSMRFCRGLSQIGLKTHQKEAQGGNGRPHSTSTSAGREGLC